MTDALADVFFYGLFMDPQVLLARGIEPRSPRKAVAPGMRLVIGRRATLRPEFGAQAFGIVYSLTTAETLALYSEPGLEAYAPRSVLAHFEDGTATYVTAFVVPVEAAGAHDGAYEARLRAVIAGMGLPAD